METRRNALLADLARDADIERSDFLVRAGQQLDQFMSSHAGRIRQLGGLVLIDDDPDYLAVAADGTFRSRSRVFDETTGQWISETEVIETAAELAEIYNPADILQAFADAEADDAGVGEDVGGRRRRGLGRRRGAARPGRAATRAMPAPPTSGPPGSRTSPRSRDEDSAARRAVRAGARLPGPQPADRGRA